MIWLFLACPAPADKESLESLPVDTGDSTVIFGNLNDAQTIITGIESQSAGTALAAGDFSGDGVEDVAVSAYAGGPSCIFTGPLDKGLVPLDSGLCYTPTDRFDFAGISMAGVGDLDGDGDDELAIGAIAARQDSIQVGMVYLVGMTGGSLTDAPVQYWGETSLDYAGAAVAGAGDVNGDGFGDLLIGATGNDAGGSGGGKAYLILGPPQTGSLTDVGISFIGAGLVQTRHATPGGGDGVGYAILGVGDTDGDGLDDVLIGAAGSDGADTDTGKACLFREPIGAMPLSEADGCLLGASASAFAGDRVAGAGDTDGDGLADLLISADGEGYQAGTIYLWQGALHANISLSYAPVAWDGEAEGDQAGYALVGNLDANGDGQLDVVIGAWANDAAGIDAGRSYLVEGPFSAGRFSLTEMRHFDGAVAGDYSGRALVNVDTNGDLVDELLIGAPFAAVEGILAGRAYLMSAE